MTYFEAILYGLIQGVAEYLPISSSAHLILLPKFLGSKDPGLTFDVFLHVGTLMATLIYFWKDWLTVFQTLKRGPTGLVAGGVDWRPILIATVPALAAGALLHDWVETVFRGDFIIASALVVGGLLLFGVDHFVSRKRSLGSLTWRDALFVGVAQCFALVPGMSRSGSSIIGARLLQFDRASAARFSFLISAPVTAAAVVFELRNWDQLLQSEVGLGPLLVAGVSAFIFGCLTISGLLKLLKHFGYLSFAVYRVVLALVIVWTL